MSYRNPRDVDGKCSDQGAKAEHVYARILEDSGFDVVKATIQEQFKGIDFNISGDFSVDVKAMKRLQRSGDVQDKYVWLEIKNTSGGEGWLYKEADFVAFEREEDFIMIKKKYPQNLVEDLVDLETFVANAQDCLYKAYTRKDRKDLLTMIQMSDLLIFPHIKICKGSNEYRIN